MSQAKAGTLLIQKLVMAADEKSESIENYISD